MQAIDYTHTAKIVTYWQFTTNTLVLPGWEVRVGWLSHQYHAPLASTYSACNSWSCRYQKTSTFSENDRPKLGEATYTQSRLIYRVWSGLGRVAGIVPPTSFPFLSRFKELHIPKSMINSHINQSPEKYSNCISYTWLACTGSCFLSQAVGSTKENFW